MLCIVFVCMYLNLPSNQGHLLVQLTMVSAGSCTYTCSHKATPCTLYPCTSYICTHYTDTVRPTQLAANFSMRPLSAGDHGLAMHSDLPWHNPSYSSLLSACPSRQPCPSTKETPLNSNAGQAAKQALGSLIWESRRQDNCLLRLYC